MALYESHTRSFNIYDYSTLYHKNALQLEASIIQDAVFTVVRRVSPRNRSLEQAQECD